MQAGDKVYLAGGSGPEFTVLSVGATTTIVQFSDTSGNVHRAEILSTNLTPLVSGTAIDAAGIGILTGDAAGSVLPAIALTAAVKLTVGTRRVVRLVSTSNLSLTGAATIDGSAVVTGDRVLAVKQTAGAENGIWIASTTGAWTRAADWATGVVTAGVQVSVTVGTAWAGSTWFITTAGAITVDTTAIVMYPKIHKGTSAAMTAGSITISNVWLLTGANVQLTQNTAGGTPGILGAATASRSAAAGTGSFIITSGGSDTSTVDWLVTNA